MPHVTLAVWCLAMTLGISAAASAADFMESWYMSRGRANMEIENYKAAIEAFEKVVERDPTHREALRSLGLAYEKQGLKDKAIETFDRYLARYDDDPEIAFRQAQALEWSRYAYREKDMLKYYRMGLKRKDDPAMRLKYAAHLSRQKETSQEAIAQYEKVLAGHPHSVEAHRGLAKAYAWLGNNDQALYHTNLALTYARREPGDMTTLRTQMMRGREPTLEGTLGFLAQPERPYELFGFRAGSRAKVDLTPFSTSTLEAGMEHFWDSRENRAGGYLSLGTQYRFNPANRVEGLLEYHGAVRGDGLAYKFEYAHDGETFSVRPGIKRDFRYDSFAALVGSRRNGELIGVARSTNFYTTVSSHSGDMQMEVTPFVGWVSDETRNSNSEIGLDAKVSRPFFRTDAWQVSAEYLFYLVHYGEDHSGFVPGSTEPLPGGYFSPRVFLDQIPRLAATYVGPDKEEWYVAAGPAIQYIDEAGASPVIRVGGDAHASYTTPLRDRFLLKVMADYTQVVGFYMRLQMNALLVYRFS